MKRNIGVLVGATALVGSLAVATPALATPIVFTFAGNSSADARPQDGKATLDIVGSTLTLTLENTAGGGLPWNGGISSTITGMSFTKSGSGTVALTSAFSSRGENCFGLADGTPCTDVSLAGAPVNYDWFWGSGFGGVTGLFAGNGGKPYGIVNDQVNAEDGLRASSNHNPLLLTTVFQFSVTGDLGAITSAKMFFGTGGENQTGVKCDDCGGTTRITELPEPTTLILLGSGIAGLVARRRRRA